MTVDVSLIMPAWRPRPDWLQAAVASALDETACSVELIVVDDGSENPVETILAGVGDPRLRVLRVDHQGPYGARNAGIAAANGAFLRFVDADDLVEVGSTGRLLSLARATGEALPYGDTVMCDENLEPERVVASRLDGLVAEASLLGEFHVYVVSILFPRAVVERSGLWEESFRVSGDWDFVLRALEHAPARPLGEVATRYRRHSGSVTKSADVAAGAAASRLVLARYFERHPEQRGGDLERRAYTRLHLDRARAHAFVGARAAAGRELAAAARRDPGAALGAAVRWARGRLLR